MSDTRKRSKKKKIKSKIIKGQPGWMQNRTWHLIAIMGLAFLVYANTLGHQYTQDDAIVITDNMFTTQGIKGIPGILQYDTFYGFFKEEGKAKLVTGGRYRPFSLLTFALEYSLFGANPLISHLLNALFFAGTAGLLYLVLLLLLPPGRYGTQAYFIALMAGLLFAAHPIHTEAVANIKGRDEILALLGSLGALFFAVKAIRQTSYRLHLWGALCLLAGLLSKENAITFLAIIPLSQYFFTPAKGGQIVRHLAPYLVTSAIFLAIRSSILGFDLGTTSNELMNNPFLRLENGNYIALGFAERMATVIYTLGRYLQLLFFPHPLTHDYYPRHIELMSWGDPGVLLSLVIYLFLLGYAFWRLPKKDLLAYGILFYLLSLSIVSNIVFPVGTNMAERLLFMPSVGYCIALSVLLYRLGWQLSPGQKLTQFKYLRAPLAIALALTLGYAAKTIHRNQAWKDNYTLFTTDVQTSRNSAKLRNAVGGEIISRYGTANEGPERSQKLQEAIDHLEKALEIHPYYKNAYLLKGNAHFYLKQYEQAIQNYQEALRLDPNYADAQRNLGISYRDAGRFYGEQQGNLNQAVRFLQQAEQYLPDDYETLRLLGVAYGIQGNGQRAVDYFQRAAEASPETADAWYNLGTAHLSIGNQAQGEQYRQKALQMDPEVAKRMNQ